MKHQPLILLALVFVFYASAQVVSDLPVESGQNIVNYTYDSAGRLSKELESYGSITFGKSYSYNLGELSKTVLSYDDCTVEYDSNGNILQKSDAGRFSYASEEKPYAITRASFSDTAIPTSKQTVAYTSFSRSSTVKEGASTATFTYGAVIGATGTLLESAGNSLYFGDKFVSAKNLAISVVAGAAIGGTFSGISALRQGQNFFNGSYVNTPMAPAPKAGQLSEELIVDFPKNGTPLAKPVSENPNVSEIVHKVDEEIVDHEKIRRLADELGPHLDKNIKPYQEVRVTWIEGEQQLSFRIETHDNLNLIFPEYSRTDKIYHMNVQLLGKNSHGKYINPYLFSKEPMVSSTKIIT